MTCTTATRSKRRLSAKLALGLAISAVLVLGTFATSASAAEHRDNRRGGDRRVYRAPPRANWNGGYYPAPPVVYGSPYYYPPPVVYGPGININVPGISIGIQ